MLRVKDRNDSDNQCKILRKKPSFGDKSDDKPIVRRIDTCTGKGIIVPVTINQVNDLSAFFDQGSDVCLMVIDNVTKFGVKNIMLCKEQLKVGENQEWNVIGTGKTALTLGKKNYTVKCRLINNMNIIHSADILLGDDFLKKTKGYEVDYEKGTFKTIRGEREQKRDFENTSDLIHTKKGHKKNQCKILRKKPSFGDKSDDKPIVRRIDTCTGKGIIVPVTINQVNDLSAFFDQGSDVCLMVIDNVTKFGVKNIMLCKEQLKVGENQEWNVIGTGKTALTL
uniref:Peptidase A2 domain-containing protein n=1 Tax=Strongyloides papillosus TaxID=174720 RepID=A0A0N5C9J0_STREA